MPEPIDVTHTTDPDCRGGTTGNLRTGGTTGSAGSDTWSRAARGAPIWQWDDVFPGGVDGPTFRARRARLLDALPTLQHLVGEVETGGARADRRDDVANLERMIRLLDGVLRDERILSLYLAGLCWADMGDQEASTRYAAFQANVAPITGLVNRLTAWAGGLPVEQLVARSQLARDHAHWLARTADAWARQPSRPSGESTAEDPVTGRPAWTRLYEDLVGSLRVEFHPDAAPVPINIATAASLNGTPEARQRAQFALAAAWRGIAVPAAACLNAIKGDELRTTRAHGWDTSRARSLAHHGVNDGAFADMRAGADDAREVLRGFARSKALVGTGGPLPWWDLTAALPGEPTLTWGEAVETVVDAFYRHHPPLAAHARRALAGGWIHAAPTPGKRATALCLPLENGTSRLMLTFDGSQHAVRMLAHELGHSYHYALQAGESDLQRQTSLVLREVVSMLSEAMVTSAPHHDSDATGAGLSRHRLNARLAGPSQVLLGAQARHLFEERLLARRPRGPLSPGALEELMTGALTEVCQDSVDESTLPTHMWISHPHLYTSTFHGWPYMFATMIVLSLHDADDQLAVDWPALDRLLARAGRLDPEPFMAGLGFELRDPAFWQSGVEALRTRVARFATLAG